MSDISVELDVYFGWCTLRITSGTDSIEVQTHWLHDALTDLAEAVRLLLDDTPSVSVVLPREIGGGHFLDLLLDRGGGVSVVVHERADGGRTTAEVFSAERGPVLLRCHVPLADLVTAFVRALRAVRVRAADASGFMLHWRRTFPSAAYEELERIAVRRYGHKPSATGDIPPDERPDGPRGARSRG